MELHHVETARVRACEVGPDGLARPGALCDYLQEAAGNHALALGLGIGHLMENGLTWVLAVFSLRMREWPVSGEDVAVTTWPATLERLLCRREFELTGRGGRVLGTGASFWAVMDLASRRVVRVPQFIVDVYPKEARTVVADPVRKPGSVDAPASSVAVPVRLADIDVNRHVNNARYLDFALEAVAAQAAGRALAAVDICFKSEAVHGDVVVSRAQPGGEGEWLHALHRQADGAELARARTLWA